MCTHFQDLKLENVLLTSPVPGKANAKLADFGLHKCIKARNLLQRQSLPTLLLACSPHLH